MDDLRRQAEESPGWVDDVVINLKLLWFQNEWIKAVTYLSIWTLFGIVYGMYSSQNMTFLTALYFAVTSISTAGLEGLKPFAEFSDRTGLDSNISVDSADFYMAWKYQYHFAFVAIYTLIGVPLFGWSIAAIGSIFTDMIMTQDAEITLNSAFTHEEYEMMLMLGKGKFGEGFEDKAVTMQKFVECQLLRLGKCSVDDLFEIKAQFVAMDLDASGLVDEHEIMESGGKVESKTSMDHQAMRDALKSMEEKHDMVFKEYHEIEARKKAEEDARPACSVCGCKQPLQHSVPDSAENGTGNKDNVWYWNQGQYVPVCNERWVFGDGVA